MSTQKLKRFTKSQFVKQIGRELLDQFFQRHSAALAERQLVLPASELDEKDYYEAVTRLIKSPEGLPESLVEAAYAIADMADEDGEERLEEATGPRGLAYEFAEDLTRAGKAMKAWLTNEALFLRAHKEVRAARVATFDYLTSKPENRDFPFSPPDTARLALMRDDLEAEFRKRNRGTQATGIGMHIQDGEYWLTIQHGNTYTRVPTVANGQVSVLHFRPAEESLVVINLERDELRIHAARKWQVDLIRRVVGERLFGNPQRFSERKSYTLLPLMTEGIDALDARGIAGLTRIVLREVELFYRGQFKDVVVRKSEDIFESAKARRAVAIPEGARPVRATFDFYFEGSDKPRKVHIRLPNKLKLARFCDATVVHRWIGERGFAAEEAGETNRGGISCVERLALP
jgi:hypothetical protein